MDNRKKNGKRSATSSSEDPSMRAWYLAEEVDKKLVQAKAVCGLMLHMKDIDELAFKELRGMTPKEVQSS